MESEEAIRRRVRIEAHERWQISRRWRARRRRSCCLTVLVLVVLCFALLLWVASQPPFS